MYRSTDKKTLLPNNALHLTSDLTVVALGLGTRQLSLGRCLATSDVRGAKEMRNRVWGEAFSARENPGPWSSTTYCLGDSGYRECGKKDKVPPPDPPALKELRQGKN